jgi:hypothetical protein
MATDPIGLNALSLFYRKVDVMGDFFSKPTAIFRECDLVRTLEKVEGLLSAIFPGDEELSPVTQLCCRFLLSPMAVTVPVIGRPVIDETFSTVAW